MWQIQDEEHKTSSREDTEKRDFDAESWVSHAGFESLAKEVVLSIHGIEDIHETERREEV
jgi:hypothetical protein